MFKNVDEKQLRMIDLLCWPEEKISALKMNEDLDSKINTLVDLMSRSDLNEKDLHKVYSLKNVHGVYTSISKDFLKDNFGFVDLKRVIEKLFKFLKEDKELPTKFAEVYEDTSWFKQLEETYSKVEINALDSVKKIMNEGIFKIAVDNVKIWIPNEDENENEKKVFDFEYLKELLSRLSLHTGLNENSEIENEKEIKRLNARINILSKLLNYLMDLKWNGSLLFADCLILLRQNPESNFNVDVNLGISSALLQGDKNKSVDDHLKNICDTLDIIIKDWIKHSSERRNKYKYMKFFTNQQILIIQRDISHFHRTGIISKDLIYLSNLVVENCTENNLIEAIKKAQSHINRIRDNNKTRSGLNGDEFDSLDSNDKDMKEKTEELEKFLKKSHLPATLIQVSIAEFGSLPLKEAKRECMKFCIRYRKDPENIHKFKKSIGEKIQQKKVEDKSLGGQIYGHWKEFLKAFKENNEYISLEELGNFLDNIVSIKQNEESNIDSNQICKMFKPTLVVCDLEKMWEIVLHLFFHMSNTTLPSSSQILLANEDTSIEELDLICSRAKIFPNQLHMILNVHELHFEAANAADKKFSDIEMNDEGKVFPF